MCGIICYVAVRFSLDMDHMWMCYLGRSVSLLFLLWKVSFKIIREMISMIIYQYEIYGLFGKDFPTNYRCNLNWECLLVCFSTEVSPPFLSLHWTCNTYGKSNHSNLYWCHKLRLLTSLHNAVESGCAAETPC